MTLRIEFIADAAGVVRPYLVDAERDEVLPGQIACSIEAAVTANEYPTVTVSFAVDGHEVAFAPSVQLDAAE